VVLSGLGSSLRGVKRRSNLGLIEAWIASLRFSSLAMTTVDPT